MVEYQPMSEFDRSEPEPTRPGVSAKRIPETDELRRAAGDGSASTLETQADAALRAVRAVREMGCDAADLPGLADIVDDQISPVLSLLGARLEQREAPLAREDQAFARTYATLLSELANLHLSGFCAGPETGAAGVTQAGPHLRRALALSHALSLHLWRLYQAEPAGFWHQVHLALQVAERLNLASETPAAAERGRMPGIASVRTVVARIAVLASSDVYALRRREMRRLAQWLQELPLSCVDEAPQQGDEGRALIRLTLGEDRPPSLIMGESPRDANTRYVDLNPVLEALDSDPEGLLSPGVSQAGPSSLSQRLRRRWIVPPARRFQREPADFGPLITVTGLHAIRAMIGVDLAYQRTVTELDLDLLPGGLFAPEGNDAAHLPAILILGAPGARDPQSRVNTNGGDPPAATEVCHFSDRQLERVIRTWESALGAVDMQSVDAEPAETPGDSRPRPTVGWLKDVGAGGCCLHLQSPADTILCGNLIAIRITEQERTFWPLGMIRWLRYDGVDSVTVGVQYLSHNSLLTEVSPDEGATQPGLFFHEYGKGHTAILLASPGALAPGARMAFSIGNVQHKVTLTSLRPEGHALWRVEFLPE
jgi:cyclic-di-GMP-binding protein